MISTGHALVGKDRLIVPSQIDHIFVSPRTRAKRTLELLFQDHPEDIKNIPCDITEDIREWDYGEYEGKKTAEIRALRKAKGLDQDHPWSIWEDGCEGGEMPQQVQERIDRLIDRIQAIHQKALDENRPSDVLVFGHGHILRCFVLRWVKRPITVNPSFILEAGGVGVLSYEHYNCSEPAISLGGAFAVPHTPPVSRSGTPARADVGAN